MRAPRRLITLLLLVGLLGGCGDGLARTTPLPADEAVTDPEPVIPAARPSPETQAILAIAEEVESLTLVQASDQVALWRVQQAERWGLLGEWEGSPVWLVDPADGGAEVPEAQLTPAGEVLVQTSMRAQLFRLGATPERLFLIEGQRYVQTVVEPGGQVRIAQANQLPLDRHPNFVVVHHWRWEEGRLWSVPSPRAPLFTPTAATAEALAGGYASQWWLELGDGALPLWFTEDEALIERQGELHRLKLDESGLIDLAARVEDLDGDGQRELLVVGRSGERSQTLMLFAWEGSAFTLKDLVQASGGLELSGNRVEPFTLFAYSVDGQSLRYRYQNGKMKAIG